MRIWKYNISKVKLIILGVIGLFLLILIIKEYINKSKINELKVFVIFMCLILGLILLFVFKNSKQPKKQMSPEEKENNDEEEDDEDDDEEEESGYGPISTGMERGPFDDISLMPKSNSRRKKGKQLYISVNKKFK